jgi:hypothetical protein
MLYEPIDPIETLLLRAAETQQALSIAHASVQLHAQPASRAELVGLTGMALLGLFDRGLIVFVPPLDRRQAVSALAHPSDDNALAFVATPAGLELIALLP